MSVSTSLASHIAALRAKEAASPAPKQADDCILFWGTEADKSFLPHLKQCVGSATTFLRLETVTTLTSVKMYCKQKGITRVISSSPSLLAKLLNWDKKKAPSLDNYSGSYFSISGMAADDPAIEIVFIQPLKQLVTVPFGKFVARRLITKLTAPAKWYTPTVFTGYTLLTPENSDKLFTNFSSASLICIDIETLKEDAVIRCLSYTAFFLPANTSISVVLPLDSEYALAVMRKWNWQLRAPKVFQNGKYDLAYLTRYSAPVYAYLYDTANLFHCWYSELPKDLGFLNSFFIRQAVYWKDLSETNDLDEYYRYNALDTWGTGNCFLAMLQEAPEYALNNYLLEFPLTFPCHMSEMTGIARDMPTLIEAQREQQAVIEEASRSLNTILDIPAGESFNVNSPVQMKQLLKVLGCSDLTSADEKNLKKARFRHPLNARIIALVLKIRKARKLVSTYLTPGKEFSGIFFHHNQPASSAANNKRPRILYSLNPHGTDTSRLASREHHFWCGLQVQNIPRGPAVKSTFIADPDFAFAEVDLEQAESRDTGYISGDETLIHNVEYSPDFHCSNASAFFGIPFEELFDAATGKVLNKPIRQLGKPVNHGANYNMGAYVLIDTMGEENIVMAKQLLNLPRFWSYLHVAEYLLSCFHKTYPGIKGVFYKGVVEEIERTRMLRSMAVHHSWELTPELKELAATAERSYSEQVGKAWVRYCFANPSTSKPALNAYIAHPPQSLNAQTLNKAYLSVFHDIAINPKHSNNFKLLAQIHDSILFQYRLGHEYLCDMVVERMQIPVTIKGYDGKTRTFVVPAGAKRGMHLDAPRTGRALYWSETE